MPKLCYPARSPYPLPHCHDSRELKHSMFWSLERQPAVNCFPILTCFLCFLFLFFLSYLFTSRDYKFEVLWEITILASEIVTSGLLPSQKLNCSLMGGGGVARGEQTSWITQPWFRWRFRLVRGICNLSLSRSCFLVMVLWRYSSGLQTFSFCSVSIWEIKSEVGK